MTNAVLHHRSTLLLFALIASMLGSCDSSAETAAQDPMADGRARGPEPLEALRKEYETYLETAALTACSSDDECTLISPGCPLGCFVAVRKDKRQEAEAKARAMITEYSGGKSICSYNCAASARTTCTAQRCTVVSVPGPAQN